MNIENEIEQLIAQSIDSKVKFEEIYEQYLAHKEDLTRTNSEIHLSASAVVWKNKKRLFFIEHPYQHELLLPAGHVETGESPLDTAKREFHEETGYFATTGKLIDLNLISIPENKQKKEQAHVHIDFRYSLILSDQEPEKAELPVYFLEKEEAPKEFQKYYD